MVIFLQFLRKIVSLKQYSFIKWSTPMESEHSVIEGLHCIGFQYVVNVVFPKF